MNSYTVVISMNCTYVVEAANAEEAEKAAAGLTPSEAQDIEIIETLVTRKN